MDLNMATDSYVQLLFVTGVHVNIYICLESSCPVLQLSFQSFFSFFFFFILYSKSGISESDTHKTGVSVCLTHKNSYQSSSLTFIITICRLILGWGEKKGGKCYTKLNKGSQRMSHCCCHVNAGKEGALRHLHHLGQEGHPHHPCCSSSVSENIQVSKHCALFISQLDVNLKQ